MTPETKTDLEKLREQAIGCTRCSLSEHRTQVVFGVGPEKAPLMFVGEAPGKNEDQEGEPFVGRAGTFMDDLLADLDIHRERVYITNVVKCRPPENRDPESEEMDACETYLSRQVKEVDPDVIVALGAVAAGRLTRSSKRISKIRGEWHQYRDRRPVMPTYHPAYLLRQRSEIQAFRRDIKKVFNRLEENRLIVENRMNRR